MGTKTEQKKTPGRPTKYTKELGEKICERIATSSIGLKTICEENGIEYTTLKRWLNDNEEFRTLYARAKEDQADHLAEEIIAIADDSKNDTQKDDEGNEIVNHDNIQRAKLRVDARKFIAAKLKPKKYGDKLDVTSDGESIVSYRVGYKKSNDPDPED